ncbi:MAG: phage protein Gp36 family protein [Phycisphaerae bacterium]
MAYVTADEIASRLGPVAYVQLTDDSGSGTPDLVVVEEARAAAEGEVDAYLARRWAVPLELSGLGGAAGLIRGWVLDVVEYRLHARRPPVPADVIRKHDAAVSALQRLVSGGMALPTNVGVAANAAAAPVAEVTGPARMFSRESLERN